MPHYSSPHCLTGQYQYWFNCGFPKRSAYEENTAYLLHPKQIIHKNYIAEILYMLQTGSCNQDMANS